jgi:hypothetical protein
MMNNKLKKHSRQQKSFPVSSGSEAMMLNIVKGTDRERGSIKRLLEAASADHHISVRDFNPGDYLVLHNGTSAVAAIKYHMEAEMLEIEDIAVHPLYPEKTVELACQVMLKGIVGRQPVYR